MCSEPPNPPKSATASFDLRLNVNWINQDYINTHLWYKQYINKTKNKNFVYMLPILCFEASLAVKMLEFPKIWYRFCTMASFIANIE